MKPIVLAILDGWGISPAWGGNAIEMYSPTNFNRLWRSYPHLILKSIYSDQKSLRVLANSEIGHMMIGSGRNIFSDSEIIDTELYRPDIDNNPTLQNAVNFSRQYDSEIHLLGIASEGKIHGSLEHIIKLLGYLKRHGAPRVCLHLITDGRDVEESTAGIYIAKVEQAIKKIGIGKIASISGRFYAMDRDNHWDRSERYVNSISGNKILAKALDPMQVVHQAYDNNVTDEMIPPTMIYENGFPVGIIRNNDVVILTNYRSDRMRQLYLLLSGIKKTGWFQKQIHNLRILTFLGYHFSEYSDRLSQAIFPEEILKNVLVEVLSNHYLTTTKVAESEKLAHVTYFFNGGIDQPFAREKRVIIKSLDVDSFAEKPEMKAKEISDAIFKEVALGEAKLIVANYANLDEVAHTGDILATSKAVSFLDGEIGRLANEAENGRFSLILTADHGNAEQMVSSLKNYNPETFHTVNPVPFIYIDKEAKLSVGSDIPSQIDMMSLVAKSQYSLKDIAPTLLDLLGIPIPPEMTGVSLTEFLSIKEKVNESTN